LTLITSRSLLGGALTVNLILCLRSSGDPEVERDIVADVVQFAGAALRLLVLAIVLFVEEGALHNSLALSTGGLSFVTEPQTGEVNMREKQAT
jgi:hypothetical protein